MLPSNHEPAVTMTPLRVLIIEDSPDERHLIRRNLLRGSDRRYRFRDANSAAEGLLMAQEHVADLDLLFLDVDLPDMEGLEFLQCLKKVWLRLPWPVVALTSQSLYSQMTSPIGETPVAALLAAGAQDHVEKADLSPHTLTRVVMNSLERYQLSSREAQAREALEASEVRLRVALAEAEAANRTKSEFLANLSHEIRTPMSAMLGFVEVLADHLHDPDDLASVEIIQRNGLHLLDLINDILDISSIEAGRLVVQREAFPLQSLLAEVHSLMAVRARERGLSLSMDFRGPFPEFVVSDRRRLKQILINLLGNAIKFTETGSVELLGEMLDPEGEPRLRIAVRDTGIGIDPSQLAQLFQPFSQLDSSVTRSHEGSGLGLAISQRLAQLLDGEIQVQSQVGEGCTFSLTVAAGPLSGSFLTRVSLDTVAEDTTPSTVPLPELTGRILVVDDRHEIRYLVQRYLEEAGAQVSLAQDGAEALTAVAHAAALGDPFAGVIMDIQMPVMDGLTAIRQLRQRGYQGQLIALTAHAMKGDREKYLAAGCNAYLSKPVDSQALVTLVAECFESAAEAAQKDSSTVLVVDDSQDATDALVKVLGILGYPAQGAYSAQQALAQVAKMSPHVVLVDLNLADQRGEELLQQLRKTQNCQQSRFIALSGEHDLQARAQQGGFDHWLQKPAAIPQLRELLADLMAHSTPGAREQPVPPEVADHTPANGSAQSAR